jgi:phosphomannomutase
MAGPFTLANVRRAAFGLGKVLSSRKRHAKVLVGFDTRRHSPDFAKAVATVLASMGHRAHLASRLLPTPALSLAVKSLKADAGVMITASHNDGSYNGFKIKLPPGVSAPPSFTGKVEAAIPSEPPAALKASRVPRKDWLSPYLAALRSKVDLKALQGAGLKVAVDSMHGVGMRHFERLLTKGRTRVRTVGGDPRADFKGRHPEPIAKNLFPLSRLIRSWKADLGFATDGDGDRVGMMDSQGGFVDVHKVHALLLYHLWINRGMRGAVVRTVSGTLMVERMARQWGIRVFETPIGFKHIGAVMLKEDVLLGLEESGGIAVKGHIPERDGLYSALLLMEALVALGKSVAQAVAFLQDSFGPFHSSRVDVPGIPSPRQARILMRLRKSPPSRLAGRKVEAVQTLDGVKFKFQDAWLLVRASGTEPLLRLYAEAPSEGEVKDLLAAAAKEARR